MWRITAAVRKPLTLKGDPGSVQPRYETNKQTNFDFDELDVIVTYLFTAGHDVEDLLKVGFDFLGSV